MPPSAWIAARPRMSWDDATVTDDRMVELASNWFEYVRRTGGSRAERKALELGEPAEVVRAAEQVREVVDNGGAPAVELIAVLLDHASNDEALAAVAAGPLED